MAVDINELGNVYFVYDKPVPYKLKCGNTIDIKPVKMTDYMVFMTSYAILNIDKNKSNDIEIIQMSYLKYLYILIQQSPIFLQQMVNICLLCLGFEIPFIRIDDKGKAILYNLHKDDNDKVAEVFSITAKEFDDIRRIIMYQNIPSYDDSYIDPELKENMEELDAIKAKDLSAPSLERQAAIITSHTGISKNEQFGMTMRSYSMLFQEVVGEVEYMAKKPIAIYAGSGNDVQWIFEKKKDKFDGYIMSKEDYNKSMGGNGNIPVIRS